MADGDPLPDDDQVAHGCGPRGEDNGIVTSAAFKPRPQDQGQLSCDWVQCAYAQTELQTVEGSIQRLRKRLTKYPHQLIAFIEVKHVRGLHEDGRVLDAIECQIPNDPCHAAIVGMTESGNSSADRALQEGLADLANNQPLLRLSS